MVCSWADSLSQHAGNRVALGSRPARRPFIVTTRSNVSKTVPALGPIHRQAHRYPTSNDRLHARRLGLDREQRPPPVATGHERIPIDAEEPLQGTHQQLATLLVPPTRLRAPPRQQPRGVADRPNVSPLAGNARPHPVLAQLTSSLRPPASLPLRGQRTESLLLTERLVTGGASPGRSRKSASSPVGWEAHPP